MAHFARSAVDVARDGEPRLDVALRSRADAFAIQFWLAKRFAQASTIARFSGKAIDRRWLVAQAFAPTNHA